MYMFIVIRGPVLMLKVSEVASYGNEKISGFVCKLSVNKNPENVEKI